MLQIWLLYWVPFFFPIIILIKSALTLLIMFTWCKCIDNYDDFFLNAVVKIVMLCVAADSVGLAVFFVFEMLIFPQNFTEHHALISISAFTAATATNILLQYRFSFKKYDSAFLAKILGALMIAAFTAPYLFFLPY